MLKRKINEMEQELYHKDNLLFDHLPLDLISVDMGSQGIQTTVAPSEMTSSNQDVRNPLQ